MTELDAEFERATALRDRGDLKQACEILERLSREHPSVFGVWLVLGGVQMARADYAAAEQSFSVATAMKPRSELASLALFHTLRHLERVNDAFAEMRRFLTLRPESRGYELLREELDENDA